MDFQNHHALCTKGAELANELCIEPQTTSYFILNREISTSLSSIKHFEGYRAYFSPEGFAQGEVAQMTRNRKIVRKIVVICPERLAFLPRLCTAVEDTILCSDEELECLEAYARLTPNIHKNLFPGEPLNLEPYAITSNRSNPLVFADSLPWNDQTIPCFGVSLFGMSLQLPQSYIEEYQTVFAVQGYSYEKARNLLANRGISAKNIWILATTVDSPVILEEMAQKYNKTLLRQEEISCDWDVVFALVKLGAVFFCDQTEIVQFIEGSGLDCPFSHCDSDSLFAFEQEYLEKQGYLSRRDEYENRALEKTLAQIKLGAELAQKHCPYEENSIYLLANRHIGDAFLFLKRVRGIKEFYAPENSENSGGRVVRKIYLITTPLLGSVGALFPDLDGITTLPSAEVQGLRTFVRSIPNPNPHIFSDAMLWVDHIVEEKLYGLHEISHQLPFPPNYPKKFPSYSTLSQESVAKAQAWLDERNCTPEKCVIIAPYAQTSSSFSQKDCQMLIDYCNQKGYTMFTNCSPTESPLDGTEKMVLPLDVCCGLSSLGCRFVCSQSGFSDILRWLERPRLTLLVVMQSILECEMDWAREWKVDKRVSRLDESLFLYYAPEDRVPLDLELKTWFAKLFEEGFDEF
ncbi:MAG: hypothetical protein R3Y07_00175 [Eubacteriales bacterium]